MEIIDYHKQTQVQKWIQIKGKYGLPACILQGQGNQYLVSNPTSPLLFYFPELLANNYMESRVFQEIV